MTTALPHAIEREVLICAERSLVYRFFTDSALFATWWGAGSEVDARVGGRVRIRYPNGVLASGEFIELVPHERVVFTYGYEAPDKPIPPGGSRVVVTLHERHGGTLLHLRHEFADRAVADEHLAGWRYQLAVFANVAAREQHAAGLDERLARWFAAWNETDEAACERALGALVSDDFSFRDAFGCVTGRGDFAAHLAALRRHMPGLRLEARGPARLCQGVALVEWRALGPDGSARGQGTNVVELAPDGRLRGVVGFRERSA